MIPMILQENNAGTHQSGPCGRRRTVATMLLTRSRPVGNALAMGWLFLQPDLEENSMVSLQGAKPRGAPSAKSSILLTSGVLRRMPDSGQTL